MTDLRGYNGDAVLRRALREAYWHMAWIGARFLVRYATRAVVLLLMAGIVGLGVYTMLVMVMTMAHGQGMPPAPPSREGVAIQVLQSQRNGALDSVVGCMADGEVRRAELEAKVADLQKQLEAAKAPKPE